MKAMMALDPHQEAPNVHCLHSILRELARPKPEIEVGTVLTQREPVRVAAGVGPAIHSKGLLAALLRKARVPLGPGKIHVVERQSVSLTEAVDALLRLAAGRRAELIGLFTQGRKGILRQILGSFAETALHRSRMDLLLVNPRCKAAVPLKRIVFAHDFSENSRKDFQRTLKLCQRLKASLTVVHGAELIYDWSLNEGSPDVLSYRRKVDKAASRLELECERAGVDCDVVVTASFRSVSDAVIEEARRRRADLIVVAAKAGPLLTLMGGSVTRNVVRNSPLPVLVLR